ncbi:MAG: cytochrome C oxidase subunit IV family protein [Candidatus Binatia bacterium]
MSEVTVPVKVYVAVFAALIVLTVITAGVAFVDLGPFNAIVALTIAVAKALLVMLYFMNLRYSTRLTWIFAAAGFFWLLILLTLTMSDPLTRG